MAVHTQYHAVPHDLRAITSWPALGKATSASAFLVADPATAVGGNNHDRGCLRTRKRARVTMDLQGNRALPPPVPVPQAWDVQSRALCSGSTSTSGRPPSTAPVSQGLLSQLYHHSVEIDLLLRIETERLRAGLQDARRHHARAVLAAMERAAARRLWAAEAGLERALVRNVELDEMLRQTVAEGQAWQGVAKSHEAVAVRLRATLDNLMQSPCAGAGAEDAQSCCLEQEQEQGEGAEASGEW